MSSQRNEETLISESIDHVNKIRRTNLGMDPVGSELIHSTTTTLNALRRYVKYKEYGTRSDLDYIRGLIETSIDSLKRALRNLEMKRRSV